MGSLIKYFFVAILGIFFFFGCASKEYFKPLKVDGKKSFNGELPSKMIDASKYGATLKNRQILTGLGLLDFVLQKDEVFLTVSADKILTTKHCNNLLIYTKDKSLQATLEIPSCPVSATINGDQIAIIGNDNTAYLYEISSKKEIFTKKSNSALAVNAVLQAPVFFGNLIFYPSLDGSVLVVNVKTLEVERSLIIDSAPFFNNVLFLEVKKDLVLASTGKRILSVFAGNTYTYEEEIRDIKIYKDKIYISTLDGQIKELDFTLKVLRSLKFQFASLPLFDIVNNVLYAVEDGSGFLIEIPLESFAPKIYKIKISRGENAFSQKKRIYYKDSYLEF